MCKVRVEETKSGFVPSEAVVRVMTQDGREELVVSADQVSGNIMEAALIHREPNRSLIELPREAFSGARRVWVENTQLVG